MSNEELVKQIQQGINSSDNMEQLYQQNYSLIRIIARKYAFNDDMDDLLQEAYFGLYEAVQRYEDTAGVLFMSYATFWIKQAIRRYIENNGRIIRIPSGLYSKILDYKKVVSTYSSQLGRKPSDSEICRHLGINEKALIEIKKAIYQYDNMQSLDDFIPEAGDMLLEDCIPDPSVDIGNDVVNRMIESNLHNELWQIVKDNTSPEENTVIITRYRKNMSLEATGQTIGKSKDMVRSLEAKAFRKLRLNKVKRILEEKFEVNYARAYRGSLGSFNNTWNSVVEDIVIKNMGIKHYEIQDYVINE